MDKEKFVRYFNELSLTCRQSFSYKECNEFDFQCPNHAGPLIVVTVRLNPSVLGEMKLEESRAEHLLSHLYTRVIPTALLLTDNFYIHKGWDYVSLRVPMGLRVLDHATSRMASKYRPSSAMAEVVFSLSKDVYTTIYVYYSEEDGFTLVQNGRPNEKLKYYGLYEQILFPNVKGIEKTEKRGLQKKLGESWVQRARVANLDGWEIRVNNKVGTQRTGAFFGLFGKKAAPITYSQTTSQQRNFYPSGNNGWYKSKPPPPTYAPVKPTPPPIPPRKPPVPPRPQGQLQYSWVPKTLCKHDRLGIGCECHMKPYPYLGPPPRKTREEREERREVTSLTESFLDARI